MTTRRTFLRMAGFAAIVGAAYGGTALLRLLTTPGLVFEPLAGIPGFRRIADGPISGGATAFVGIDDGTRNQAATLTIRDGALCAALFGATRDPSRVQIAYFTDYRCLFCRKVSTMLATMEKEGDVQVTWHDLPRFWVRSRPLLRGRQWRHGRRMPMLPSTIA